MRWLLRAWAALQRFACGRAGIPAPRSRVPERHPTPKLRTSPRRAPPSAQAGDDKPTVPDSVRAKRATEVPSDEKLRELERKRWPWSER